MGEGAPKPPNLLAIPVQRRPLFPGYITPLVINDESLIEALTALKQTPVPFVGVFMLRDQKINLLQDSFSLTSTDQIYGMGAMAHSEWAYLGCAGLHKP